MRDLLLGRGRADLDLVVEGDAAALAARLGAEPVEHERFATAKVELDGHEVDIASARSETYPHPGALPEVSRRPPASRQTSAAATSRSTRWRSRSTGEPRLIDPHGGQADLEAGLLRVLHRESFVDDPTRAIRAARYAARFGFELEPETEALLRATDLGTVSADRREAELLRLAGEPSAVRAASRCSPSGGCSSRARVGSSSRAPGRRAAGVRPRGAALALADRAGGACRGARPGGEASASWPRPSPSAPPRRSSSRAAATRSSWCWRGRSAPSGSTTTSASGARSSWRSTATT